MESYKEKRPRRDAERHTRCYHEIFLKQCFIVFEFMRWTALLHPLIFKSNNQTAIRCDFFLKTKPVIVSWVLPGNGGKNEEKAQGPSMWCWSSASTIVTITTTTSSCFQHIIVLFKYSQCSNQGERLNTNLQDKVIRRWRAFYENTI